MYIRGHSSPDPIVLAILFRVKSHSQRRDYRILDLDLVYRIYTFIGVYSII